MVITDQAIGIAGGFGQQLFPIYRAIVKYGSKAINTKNPKTIAANVRLKIVEYCAPPPIRLAAIFLAYGH